MAIKPGPAKNGYQLSDEDWQKRERVFGMYRDMGPMRGLSKVLKLLQDKHPDIAVSKSTLEHWSRAHDWHARAQTFDQAQAQGMASAPNARRRAARAAANVMQPATSTDPAEFDQIGALVMAANQALTKAMGANPVITKPGDMKLLVDAAANALKLVETIRNQSSGKVSRDEIAREMERVLGEVEKARMVDIEDLASKQIEERLKAVGIWDVLKPEQRRILTGSPASEQSGSIERQIPQPGEIDVEIGSEAELEADGEAAAAGDGDSAVVSDGDADRGQMMPVFKDLPKTFGSAP
jgi:hypothetical protein